MELGSVKTLIDFHYWANDRLLTALSGLTDDEFTKVLGSSFPSVRDTVVHLINTEAYMTRRLSGETLTYLKPEAVPTPEAAQEHWAANAAHIRKFVAGFTPEDLNRPIRPWRNGTDGFLPLSGQMLLQLVTHAVHHRGQIVTLLRQLGHAAPETDLIVYFRDLSGHTAWA